MNPDNPNPTPSKATRPGPLAHALAKNKPSFGWRHLLLYIFVLALVLMYLYMNRVSDQDWNAPPPAQEAVKPVTTFQLEAPPTPQPSESMPQKTSTP